MSDPNVARWKLRGTVYLWKYRHGPRSYSGWNLTADSQGCESLIELLDLMIASRYSSQATMRTSPPTAEALRAVSGPKRWSSTSKLELIHPKFNVEPGHWNLSAGDGRVSITAGELRLKEIRDGVIDVSKGDGDWAAPNDDVEHATCLWFWPLKWKRGSGHGI